MQATNNKYDKLLQRRAYLANEQEARSIEQSKIRNTMNKGCNEPITLGERENFDGKKGSRLVFSAPCSSLPDCPKCGHNRKVFKAGKEYVCSEFHK